MTETTKEVEAPKPKLNPVFEKLPENIKVQISTLPPYLNAKEERGQHLSPLMGRVVKATRQANGNISQKALAEQQYAKEGWMTTHCQIATLEQGGCKRGAAVQTIKLLSFALKVPEDVIADINNADLEARAAKNDEVAKKILGITPEPEPAPEPEAKPEPTAGKEVAKPTPGDVAKKAAAPAAKKATAPAPKPEASKDTVKM
jgi:hypothetical protein